MPNWTYNAVTLQGSKEQLETFRQRVKGEDTDFDFNTFAQMPQELLHTTSPTKVVATPEEADESDTITQAEADRREQAYGAGILNWYDWAVKNWGTKWNACDVHCEGRCNSLWYGFATAWNAPTALVQLVLTLALSLGLSIVWTAEDEDGTCTEIVDTSKAR